MLRQRRVRLLVAAALSGTALGIACGDGTTDPDPPRPEPPDARLPATVTITPSPVRFTALGATSQLTAQVRDRSGQMLTSVSVIWAAADDSVATVDSTGLVTSRDNGSTTITATAGTVTATAPVEVSQVVHSLDVSPAIDTLVVGDSLRLKAEPRDVTGHLVASAETTWTSSDSSVVKVEDSGLAIAVGPGRAEITATANSIEGRTHLTVTPPVATAVTVTPTEIRFMALTDTIRLSAEVQDQRGRVTTAIAVTWATADEAVATVDSAGLATAAGNGQTLISATAGDVSDSVSVRVRQSAVSVAVAPTADTLLVGDTLHLTARVTDANGQFVGGAVIDWESSDTTVAVVDEAGIVRAVDAGVASVSATSGGVSGRAELLVKARSATTLTVTPDRARFAAVGDTARLSADVRDQRGRPMPAAVVAWASGDTAVATVDSSGLVTSVRNGHTRIEARAGTASDTVTVEVSQRVDSVIVSPAADTIGVGDRVQLTAEAVDSNGHTVTGVRFEWSSSDPSVARVFQSDPGLVFARGDGVVTITATTRGVSGTAEITVRTPDGDALRAFYEATDGPNWRRNDNWLTDAPLGEWFGVGTDSQGRVRRLQLAGNNLTGTIPPKLADIPRLSTVRLSDNALAGPIPPEFGRLSSLWLLEMDGNNLTGSIPSEFGGLSELAAVVLAGNSLSGAIPPELGNSAALERLELEGNSLTGAVSEELGNLTRLSTLSLQGNRLTGPLPRKLVQLDQLTHLNFDENDGLCAPGSAEFLSWLQGVETREGPLCNQSDRATLEALYQASGGPAWTNSHDWLASDVLDAWYGVSANSLGHVRSLDLGHNGLTGRLPGVIGTLARMSELRVSGNQLSGPLPLSLVHLPLRRFHYEDTELCSPSDDAYRDWLVGIASHQGTGQTCGALSVRDVLVALYETTGGRNWVRSRNWLTDEPIANWQGVQTDGAGRVTELRLGWNNLIGPIPPELGSLANLTYLGLQSNELTGPLPPELGNLTRLSRLVLWTNQLSGALPPEIGNLAELRLLHLSNNRISGPIPPEVGGLTRLHRLLLDYNDLEDPVPWELAGAKELQELNLAYNPGLSGPLPVGLAELHQMERLQTGGTDLCAASDAVFREWLEGIRDRWLPLCVSEHRAHAYLTQAVQSRESPVPLVAGEAALLRAFITAERTTEAGMPPVRATFYVDGVETHVVTIPEQSNPIPTTIDESQLSKSINATIPPEVIRPGLEMVLEIDPEETLDPGLGVSRRIPETGRFRVDVQELPTLKLTLIPFLWSARPDSAVLEFTAGMAADPEGHERLFDTRTLLPIGELDVTAHEPVVTSNTSRYQLLSETEAIRVAEGIPGYVMGMLTGGLPQGTSRQPGKSSFATPSSHLIAHELGHNLDLGHAPCGNPLGPDLAFPDRNGRIGAWGYDPRGAGTPIWPSTPDIMSYCRPRWISPYFFAKALRYRLNEEGSASAETVPAPARSLLVWGGIRSGEGLFLESAFAIDAPSVVPRAGGEYEVTGRNTSGEELFSFRFDMPELADSEGNSSFAFAVPTDASWAANLASVTLEGPGGESVRLDRNTDRPMAMLRNPRTGQIRGFLRGLPRDVLAQATATNLEIDPHLEVILSRGLPDAEAWERR